MTSFEEKKNIWHSLLASLSHEGLRERAFDVLAKAELFIQSSFSANIKDQIDHLYKVAIETAKKLKNDSAYCKLVVNQYFRTTFRIDEAPLIPESVKANISLMRDGTGAKFLCYQGMRAIGYGESKRGVSLLTEGYSGLGRNSDQQILKCTSLQLLSMYYDHSNNPDRSTQFSQMALNQCKAIGVSSLFFIGEYLPHGATAEKAEENRSGTPLLSQPLILEIVFLLSFFAGNIISDEMKDKLSNTVCEIQSELQLQHSNELYATLETGDAALSFLSTGQKTRLDETIQSIKTELEKEEDNDNQGSQNESTSKNTMRRKLLKERLAKCYRYKSYYHSKTNDKDLTLESLQHSLDVYLSLCGENCDTTAACYSEIATEQNKIEEHTLALESLQRALDIRLKLYGEQHSDTARSYVQIGDTHFKMENYSLALKAQQHSLEIRLNVHGEQHLTTAWSYFVIGMTQFYMGDYTSALESHQHALDIRSKLHGEQDVSTACSYLGIGMTQNFMKEYKVALRSNYRALKIFSNLFGELGDVSGQCYRFIGMGWSALGNKKLALYNFQRALDIRSKIYEEGHPLMQESRNDVFAVVNDLVFVTEQTYKQLIKLTL